MLPRHYFKCTSWSQATFLVLCKSHQGPTCSIHCVLLNSVLSCLVIETTVDLLLLLEKSQKYDVNFSHGISSFCSFHGSSASLHSNFYPGIIQTCFPSHLLDTNYNTLPIPYSAYIFLIIQSILCLMYIHLSQ